MTGAERTQAGQVFAVPASPSPRKTPPHHDPNEESPESQWLFGAVWGAAAVRLPPFAPAYSPRKTRQRQYAYSKTHSYRAAAPVPRVSLVLRRDRHKEAQKPEVNQQSPITEPTIQERTTGDLDPRRNRNEAYRSPSCLALASSSKREPNAISGIPQPPGAAMKPPTPRRTAPARTNASAVTISGRHKRRAGAQFTPI